MANKGFHAGLLALGAKAPEPPTAPMKEPPKMGIPAILVAEGPGIRIYRVTDANQCIDGVSGYAPGIYGKMGGMATRIADGDYTRLLSKVLPLRRNRQKETQGGPEFWEEAPTNQ